MPQPVRKAVFPVGGLGTRFLPATKAMPKEMLPVVDKPLIQHVVDEARHAGIEEFIFVTGRGKRAIEDHFDHSFELEHELQTRGAGDAIAMLAGTRTEPGSMAYVRQIEPLGLGHAVWCARNLVGDEPFAVLLADDLILGEASCIDELIEVHAERGGNVVAVMEVPPDRVSSYGIVAPGADDGRVVEVNGLVEKPPVGEAPSNLAVVGRYVLEPEIFDVLAMGVRGAGGEIQLTDAIDNVIDRSPVHGVRFSGTRYDCGEKVGLLEASIAYALSREDLRTRVREVLMGLIEET
jgi:UTP--glucose-1-phosphate uridylyltransferase